MNDRPRIYRTVLTALARCCDRRASRVPPGSPWIDPLSVGAEAIGVSHADVLAALDGAYVHQHADVFVRHGSGGAYSKFSITDKGRAWLEATR